MGNSCCKTAVGLQPRQYLNIPRTVYVDNAGIRMRTIQTSLNVSKDEPLDTESKHLMTTNGNIFEETSYTMTNPKDELMSSGYSSGTKATGYDIPIFDESSRQSNLDDENDNQGGYEVNNGIKLEEKDRLFTNFTYLKKELDVEFVLDYLIQDDVFTDDQAEKIRLAGSRRDQVDLFLRTLLMSRSSLAFSVFMTSLDKIFCAHIRIAIESERLEKDLPDDTTLTMRMKEQILSKRRKAIVAQLEDPIVIAEYFLEHREFSLDEYEDIFYEKSRKGRAEKLLDTVLDSNHIKRGYIILDHALRMEGYTALNIYQVGQEKTNVKEVEDSIPDYELVGHGYTAAASSLEIEDDDVLRLTLNVNGGINKKRRKKEKRIVAKANKYKLKTTLNNELLCDTECLISHTEMGSIVIWIKGCRKGAIRRLFKVDTKEGVSKLLRTIFAHPDMSKEMHTTATQLQVKVEVIPGQREEIKAEITGPEKTIVSNFSFLVEELDAVCFLYLDIFTKQEKENILAARVPSRAECTKLMLNIILEKSEEKQLKFIHELKERKRFVWKHIAREESFNVDVLVSEYDQFVENLSPSILIDHCAESKILNRSVLSNETLHGEDREQLAHIMMQEILLQGYRTKNTFLRILFTLQQIPRHISPIPKGTDVKRSPTVSTNAKMFFEGKYSPSGSKESDAQRGLFESTKGSFRDDRSGYKSLSFREQRSPRWSNQEWREQSRKDDCHVSDDISKSVLQVTPTSRQVRASTLERDLPLRMKSPLMPIEHYQTSRIPRSRSLPSRNLPPPPRLPEENLEMNRPGRHNMHKQIIQTLSVSPYIQRKLIKEETTEFPEKKDAKTETLFKTEKLSHDYEYVTDIECGCFPLKK